MGRWLPWPASCFQNPTRCHGKARIVGEHLGWPLTAPIRGRSSQGVEVMSTRCPESGAGTGLRSRLECRGQQARTLAGALTPSSLRLCSGSRQLAPETGSVAQGSGLRELGVVLLGQPFLTVPSPLGISQGPILREGAGELGSMTTHDPIMIP